MIGIYKITNKLNGKSYIGQSIHCGKRLDEHCKGSQLIDEIIQLEGVENFTFEILKEVNKEELSYWEDYYIIKYNSLFPNGYNKRMNCGKEIRVKIKKVLDAEINDIRIKNNTENIDILPILRNSDSLYYWLLIHSNNNEIDIADFCIIKIAKILHRNRTTVSKRFNYLINKKIISRTKDKIIINKPLNNFIKSDIFLTNESAFTIYHYLYYNNIKNTSYKNIISNIGYSQGNSQIWIKTKNIINLLKENKLIDFSIKITTTKESPYTLVDIKLFKFNNLN